MADPEAVAKVSWTSCPIVSLTTITRLCKLINNYYFSQFAIYSVLLMTESFSHMFMYRLWRRLSRITITIRLIPIAKVLQAFIKINLC